MSTKPTPGKRVISAVLAAVLLTHGYFLIRYKALSPCEAAARKMVLDIAEEQAAKGGTTGQAMGSAFAAKYVGLPVARLKMNMESVPGCYAIALGLKDHNNQG
jgi:hypothetical protein